MHKTFTFILLCLLGALGLGLPSCDKLSGSKSKSYNVGSGIVVRRVAGLEGDVEKVASELNLTLWRFRVSVPKTNSAIYMVVEVRERGGEVKDLAEVKWIGTSGEADAEVILKPSWKPNKRDLVVRFGNSVMAKTIDEPFREATTLYTPLPPPQRRDKSIVLGHSFSSEGFIPASPSSRVEEFLNSDDAIFLLLRFEEKPEGN